MTNVQFRNYNSVKGELQTPEAGAEDLGVELLLVLADLGRVALRADVGGVHVHHRALPVVLPPDWLRLAARCTRGGGNSLERN